MSDPNPWVGVVFLGIIFLFILLLVSLRYIHRQQMAALRNRRLELENSRFKTETYVKPVTDEVQP